MGSLENCLAELSIVKESKYNFSIGIKEDGAANFVRLDDDVEYVLDEVDLECAVELLILRKEEEN